MSGLVKSVKKVFKKVAKAVKKVAPIALAVGALVFTGGAALGLTSMAGGWGAAVSGVTSAMGAGGGIVGSALTGAITQAGYGALVGGTMSAIGGGSFSQGAKAGAITGAVTGGAMGAMGMGTDPMSGIGKNPAASGDLVPDVTSNMLKPNRGLMPGGNGVLAADAPAMLPDVTGAAAGAGAGAGPAAGGGATRGMTRGLFGKGGWVERNQTMAGNILGGVGQGLMASAGADADIEATRERYNQVRQNYGDADPGASYQSAAPGDYSQSPMERFGGRRLGSFEYRYNPKSGRVERTQV